MGLQTLRVDMHLCAPRRLVGGSVGGAWWPRVWKPGPEQARLPVARGNRLNRAPHQRAARKTTAWRPSVNRQAMPGGGRHTRPSGKTTRPVSGRFPTSRRHGRTVATAVEGRNL